jgi:hypothetical protein
MQSKKPRAVQIASPNKIVGRPFSPNASQNPLQTAKMNLVLMGIEI